MSGLTRGGTAEPVSRDQILRGRKRGQGKIHVHCSADHEQDWQPYPVDPYLLPGISFDRTYADTFNVPTSYQKLVWKRQAHIN